MTDATLARKRSAAIKLSPSTPRHYDDDDAAAVDGVLRRGRLSVVFGRETIRFENDFAQAMGADAAVAVSSGTAALELALQCAGIGLGDEVVVPAYTFAATALAVVRSLAIPRFAEIDDESWNVSAETIAAEIGPRTRAVIAVHTFGNPCEMAAIRRLCDERGLRLIEDCAQAAGASINGARVGTFGDAGCFSFNEVKNLTTGEGGAILMSDAAARRARLLRLYAAERGLAVDIGMKCTMTEMEAALGRSQLRRLNAGNAHRTAICTRLAQRLEAIDGISVQRVPAGGTHVYSRFVFCVDAARAGLDRNAMSAALRERGFAIEPVYPVPLYRQSAFAALAAARPAPGFARSYATLYADDAELRRWGKLHMEHAETFCAQQLGFIVTGETPADDIEALGDAVAEVIGAGA